MPDQTFTAGQILTAAQQTDLQTNIGLSLISKVNFTGARPAQAVSVFNSNFTNYRIVANVYGGVGEELFLRFYSGTTTEISTGNYTRYGVSQTTSGAVTSAFVDSGNRYVLGEVAASSSQFNSVVMDVFNPNTPTRTTVAFTAMSINNGQYLNCTGQVSLTTQITGFLLQGLNNNITGNLAVYGYR